MRGRKNMIISRCDCITSRRRAVVGQSVIPTVPSHSLDRALSPTTTLSDHRMPCLDAFNLRNQNTKSSDGLTMRDKNKNRNKNQTKYFALTRWRIKNKTKKIRENKEENRQQNTTIKFRINNAERTAKLKYGDNNTITN